MDPDAQRLEDISRIRDAMRQISQEAQAVVAAPDGNIGAEMAINPLLKNAATAHPMPNPTAPKRTNRITLVALMVCCLSYRTRAGR
jgi:hypothetical protein